MASIVASIVEILVKANTSQANAALKETGGHVKTIGDIVSGIVGANVLQRLGDGLLNMAKGVVGAGIGATSQMQSMELSLEGLMAREIARGTAVQKTSKVLVDASEDEGKASADNAEKLEALRFKYDDLQDSIAITTQRMSEWTDKTKESTKMGQRDQLEDYNHKLAVTAAQIAELEKAGSGTGPTYKTVTETIYEGARSITEVMPEAQKAAKALTDELIVMGLKSPFKVEDVQAGFQQALVYGYNAKEAKLLANGLLSMGAGLGQTSDKFQRLQYNLLQLRKLDKLTTRDIRELGQTGFDLVDTLRVVGQQYGLQINSIEDWNSAIKGGKITWDQFAVGFEKYASETFGGAVDRMAKSWSGLQNSVSDISIAIAPKLLGEALDKVSERGGRLLDKFIEIRDSPALTAIGDNIGKMVDTALGPLDRFLDWFDEYDRLSTIVNSQEEPFLLQEVAKTRMDEMTAGMTPFKAAATAAFGPETMKAIDDIAKVIQGVGDALNWVAEQLQKYQDFTANMTTLPDMLFGKGVGWGDAIGGALGKTETFGGEGGSPWANLVDKLKNGLDGVPDEMAEPFKDGAGEIGKEQTTLQGALGTHGRRATATIEREGPRTREALVRPFQQAAKTEIPEQLQIITAEVEKVKLPPLFIRIGWQIDPMPEGLGATETPSTEPHWQDIVRAGTGASFVASRPRLMLVGERGAESVNVQPLGRTTLQPAAAGMGGNIVFNFPGLSVRDDRDIDALAYKVAQALRRRNR